MHAIESFDWNLSWPCLLSSLYKKLITLFLDLITYSFTVVYYTVGLRSVFDFDFSAASSLSLLKSARYLANLCIYIS